MPDAVSDEPTANACYLVVTEGGLRRVLEPVAADQDAAPVAAPERGTRHAHRPFHSYASLNTLAIARRLRRPRCWMWHRATGLPAGCGARTGDTALHVQLQYQSVPDTRQWCEALVELYRSTNGAEWRWNHGWLQTATPCSWRGIDCYGGGSVRVIRLSFNFPTGEIPAQLGAMTNLSYW